jgi:hypothetical protein
MKAESKEQKDYCLGVKSKSPQYQIIYDALNMLIKDKNCFISNIVVLPKDKKANKALAVYRPDCKIKFGNLSPEVILQFEIDESKKNKNESMFKKVVRNFQQPTSVEVPTDFKFRRGQDESLKNAEDFFHGNKESGEQGFRELAVQAGACGPSDQNQAIEPNQPSFVQSHSSSSSKK